MFQPKNEKERALHRYKISLGHLKKVIQMIDDGVYCIDIIHQSQAVQKALHDTDLLILENHLRTCTAKAIKSGKDKKAIDDIMAVMKTKK